MRLMPPYLKTPNYFDETGRERRFAPGNRVRAVRGQKRIGTIVREWDARGSGRGATYVVQWDGKDKPEVMAVATSDLRPA